MKAVQQFQLFSMAKLSKEFSNNYIIIAPNINHLPLMVMVLSHQAIIFINYRRRLPFARKRCWKTVSVQQLWCHFVHCPFNIIEDEKEEKVNQCDKKGRKIMLCEKIKKNFFQGLQIIGCGVWIFTFECLSCVN